MRKILLSLHFLTCLNLCVFAQQARQYSFKHFSTLNGLVSNSTNAVVQDKEGFIWIATTNGLQRYDGNTFLTFKAVEHNERAIPSTHIICLFTDKKNNMWLIGDNNSVGTFDTKKFEFRKAHLPGNVVANSHQRFVEFPTGELLLLGNNGAIFQYVEKENKFVPANDKLPMPKGWKLSHITWDKNIKKFWITADSGLVQLDPVTKQLAYRGHKGFGPLC